MSALYDLLATYDRGECGEVAANIAAKGENPDTMGEALAIARHYLPGESEPVIAETAYRLLCASSPSSLTAFRGPALLAALEAQGFHIELCGHSHRRWIVRSSDGLRLDRMTAGEAWAFLASAKGRPA